MTERDPVSVLLPTTEWGTACDQLAADLESGDELLVVCDSPADPVSGHDPPEGVEILVAGEPTGCSGKANALAHGMERATNDRLVWTDDDFERDPGWLDRLVAAGERHGPASAIPVFLGRGWWRVVEPWYGVVFGLSMYLGVGGAGDTAWGGGVTFTRSELTVETETFVTELGRVLSDDALLTRRLSGVHPVRSMVTPVEVAGDLGGVVSRLVRFTRIVGVNEGWTGGVATSAVLVAVAVAFPVLVAPLVTALAILGYSTLGLRRTTAVFAYPGVFVLPLVVLAGRTVDTFEWGGRRYRYANSGEVTVLGPADRE